MPIYYFVVSFIKSNENREQSNHTLCVQNCFYLHFAQPNLTTLTHFVFIWTNKKRWFLLFLFIFGLWIVFRSHHLNEWDWICVLGLGTLRRKNRPLIYMLRKSKLWFFSRSTILLRKLCKRVKIVREQEKGNSRICGLVQRI